MRPGCTPEHFPNREEAEALAAACNGQDAVITRIVSKNSTQSAPRLFDLTMLQREANKIFGFTAQQTLDYAQSLYEKQLITYPRTDSQFLTHESESKLPALVSSFYAHLPFMSGLKPQLNTHQVINDAKVSDGKLSDSENSLMTLIIVRTICALADDHKYEDKTITVACGDHQFTAKAKTVTQMGWKAAWSTFRGGFGSKGSFEEESAPQLPEDLKEGSILHGVKAEVKEGSTLPPKHFTEAGKKRHRYTRDSCRDSGKAGG